METKEIPRDKYQNLGTPKWAEFDTRDDDEDIFKHCCHIKKTEDVRLPAQRIYAKAVSHINKQTHNEGPFITSIQFHPTSMVSLAAGSSGVLSILEVDGVENNKLQSIQFHKFPISTARFLNGGMEVILGSLSHAYCYSYDLISGKTSKIPLPHGITNMKKFAVSPDGRIIAICGRTGQIYLLSSKTKELIGTLQMNVKCQSIAFSPDSKQLFSHGDSSEIYVWDLRSHSFLHKATDDGCITGRTIAVSPSGQFIATGSNQGVVNIYDTNEVLRNPEPKPVKTVLNLVTRITNLKFNPTSEILSLASEEMKNAIKLVHLPSFTVFDNFPTFQTQLYNPIDVDFSPKSAYMGISNNRGTAHLYNLKHYKNY